VISCIASIAIVHGRTLAQAPPEPQRLVEGRAFAAALPIALTPPTLDPGVRLVSMVAADIDADGDLDVVASDGSLDLVVWTNDGTGRLTRKYPQQASGGFDHAPSQSVDRQDAADVGALPASSGFCAVPPARYLGLIAVGARDIPPSPSRMPVAEAVRAPRAPPASFV